MKGRNKPRITMKLKRYLGTLDNSTEVRAAEESQIRGGQICFKKHSDGGKCFSCLEELSLRKVRGADKAADKTLRGIEKKKSYGKDCPSDLNTSENTMKLEHWFSILLTLTLIEHLTF